MISTKLTILAIALLVLLQFVAAQPHGVKHRHKRDVAASTDIKVASSSSDKPGIVYSPYNSDGTCKSGGQITSDIEGLKGFSLLRIYGLDCDQVIHTLEAASKHGMKVFVGIYEVEQTEAQVKILITAVNNRWDMIHTVGVGNEVVNSGRMSVGDMVSNVNKARNVLRSSGYNGPVVIVDTFVAIMNNPALCEASDYVAANCHAFFDGNVNAAGAGGFLATQSQNVKNKCGGKSVIITETGWPTQGITHGSAVPSVVNQQLAIKSIIASMGSNVILFTAYDDLWKKDTPATYETEKHWGIQNLASL